MDNGHFFNPNHDGKKNPAPIDITYLLFPKIYE